MLLTMWLGSMLSMTVGTFTSNTAFTIIIIIIIIIIILCATENRTKDVGT